MFGRRKSMTQPQDPYDAAREQMIEEQLRSRGVVMHRVLEAMGAVPRHLFVAHEYSSQAYADEALPSLEGQTISQPYIVAIMTQELAIQPGDRILEIGTGTGYQTAVLAHMVGPNGVICTIERMAALVAFARQRLGDMGVNNVEFWEGDGTEGWPRVAPWDGPRSPDGEPQFDRIIVTAGAPSVPRPLLNQLRDGGIMVVPVGTPSSQSLLRVTRNGDRIEETEFLPCRFVPLVGAHGWRAVNSPEAGEMKG